MKSSTTPDLLSRLTAIRRDLHRHPQLGYQETHAHGVVMRELRRIGVDAVRVLAETGVVATILPTRVEARRRPGIALRADIDALPIHEQGRVEHASRTPGLMHACGHDGHTAALLGAAERIATGRDQLQRPVLLIFQPAEEADAGAARMISEGALDAQVNKFALAAAFALHNWPGLAAGTIELLEGPTMAGTDRFAVRMLGRGGHAAMPHLADDLPLAIAALVQQLHAASPRRVNANSPAVLTVGSIKAGDAHNVLPAEARVTGTLRYLHADSRQALRGQIHRSATGVAESFGGHAEVRIDDGYPPTVNHAAAVATARRAAESAGLTVQQDGWPSMAAEDFAEFGRVLPAAYGKLGVDPPGRHWPSLHTDTYDFNDDILPAAIDWFVALACHPPHDA